MQKAKSKCSASLKISSLTANKLKIQNLLLSLILLTILLAPLYVVRWRVLGLPTTLLETLIFLTFIVWVFGKIENRDLALVKPFAKPGLAKPILLLFLAAAISLFVAEDKRGGLGIFKAYFLEPVLFFYLLSDSLKKLPALLRSCSLALLLSGFWVSILGITQGLFGWFIFAPHEAATARAHAVYNSGNALALYLGPLILLGLWLWLKRKPENISAKFTLPLILVTMILAMVLTKSEGGLIALAISGTVLIILIILSQFRPGAVAKLRRQASIILILVYLAANAVFFLNLGRFTPKNVNPWQRQPADTLTPRLCLWEGAIKLLKEHPLFGAGLSGFKELYSTKYYTCDAEPLEYPHNLILNFWTELGLLGVLAFFWLLYKALSLPPSFSFFPFTFYFLIFTFYLLIHGLADVPYFKNDLSLQFWVILALTLTASEKEEAVKT